MILRIVSGRVREPHLRRIAAALAEGARDASATNGAACFHVGARPAPGGWELATVGAWESPEDAADAELEERAAGTAWEIAELAHFEIDASLVRRVSSDAIVRIATGRFSKPGADIEMQELLRERVPALGDPMVEAYVGRRIDGRAVEVTFVSAWDREPAGQALEGSFWPDIALRYDDFSVRLYRPVEREVAGRIG